MFEYKNINAPTSFATDFKIREELLADLRTKIKESSFDSSDALSSYRTVADEFQVKVIEAKNRTIRMLAPAGSGKTQTIVNRVLSNIRQGCNPDRILVLTFDNAAASALTSNLNNQLNDARVSLGSLPCISTVNAYGYSILREYVPREYMPVAEERTRHWIVRDIKRQLERIGADIFATLPDNLTGSYYLEFFSLLKNELFDPRKFNQQAIADFIIEHGGNTLFTSTEERYVRLVVQGMIWVFEKYDMELREKKRLDFDDQKLRSYLAMRNDRNLLSRLQGKFDEVIVDEFQDINRLDFVFIETLSGKSRLVVVGDDDQAIYGFRGCKPDFIINLESHLRRPVVSYELSVNYRCPPNIVEHATKLINHNSSRVPKTPIANRKDRASIEVLSTVSADVEAKVVVDFIRRVMQDNLNLKFNDFAILYRTNAQSLPLQVELISNNIPYYVRDKDRLQKNETLILMLGVFDLKRAVNTNRHPLPEDAVRTVCAYFRYMNLGEVGKLRKLFEQKNNFLEAINSEQFFRILPRASKSHLDLVVRDVLDATGLIETLEILQRRFKGLRGMVGSLEDVIAERTPLGEIFELAASFGDHIDTFVDTMNHIISSARASRAGEQKDTGVSLLTYFKAKGLQWHTVILTCCNEGLIPHRRANVEEERRLFYVGMTRASSNLLISYLENSCKNPVLPSRFIREAGLEVR